MEDVKPVDGRKRGRPRKPKDEHIHWRGRGRPRNDGPDANLQGICTGTLKQHLIWRKEIQTKIHEKCLTFVDNCCLMVKYYLQLQL